MQRSWAATAPPPRPPLIPARTARPNTSNIPLLPPHPRACPNATNSTPFGPTRACLSAGPPVAGGTHCHAPGAAGCPQRCQQDQAGLCGGRGGQGAGGAGGDTEGGWLPRGKATTGGPGTGRGTCLIGVHVWRVGLWRVGSFNCLATHDYREISVLVRGKEGCTWGVEYGGQGVGGAGGDKEGGSVLHDV